MAQAAAKLDVRLKRGLFARRLPKTVSASWWIASGRAAYADWTPPSTDG